MMNMLSAIYGAAVNARNGQFENGKRVPKQLTMPVVSIGNISVGGSGKTPFVIALGELLKLVEGHDRAALAQAGIDAETYWQTQLEAHQWALQVSRSL